MITNFGNVRSWGLIVENPCFFAEGGEKEEKSRGKK